MNKNTSIIISSILIVVLAIFVFKEKINIPNQNPTDTTSPSWSVSPQANTPAPNFISSPISGSLIDNGYTPEIAYKIKPDGAESSDYLFFKSPSGEKIRIPDNIWYKIDAATAYEKTGIVRGEELTSFKIPVDPLNKDIVLITTAEALDNSYLKYANRIYAYNLKTSDLTQLYYELAENNSPFVGNRPRILRTIGIEGSKLIILLDDPESSPGPCTSVWYDYKENIRYLELSDLNSGLKSYVVPETELNKAKIDQDSCQKEINAM